MCFTKSELYQMYWENNMTLTEIAALYGGTPGSLAYWFKKYGIPTRNVRVSHRLRSDTEYDKPISESLIEFIEGNLLGDGALRKEKHNVRYRHSDKHKEYIEWVCEHFEKENIKTKMWERYSRGHKYWAMETEVNANFTKMYSQWYESDRYRITIPHDFQLTPVKLRQWYISDGSRCSDGGGCNITKPVRISNSDKNRLEAMILSETGIRITWQKVKGNSQGRLYIKASDFDRFIDYIGECPVDCYAYKWR